mmetsp:Transcript_23347/g.73920  ORF Transcript_23347/g.73920 Transcript_23347/m.73920 type:complete len:367 (+) Transcript_23347:746-1846(+)
MAGREPASWEGSRGGGREDATAGHPRGRSRVREAAGALHVRGALPDVHGGVPQARPASAGASGVPERDPGRAALRLRDAGGAVPAELFEEDGPAHSAVARGEQACVQVAGPTPAVQVGLLGWPRQQRPLRHHPADHQQDLPIRPPASHALAAAASHGRRGYAAGCGQRVGGCSGLLGAIRRRVPAVATIAGPRRRGHSHADVEVYGPERRQVHLRGQHPRARGAAASRPLQGDPLRPQGPGLALPRALHQEARPPARARGDLHEVRRRDEGAPDQLHRGGHQVHPRDGAGAPRRGAEGDAGDGAVGPQGAAHPHADEPGQGGPFSRLRGGRDAPLRRDAEPQAVGARLRPPGASAPPGLPAGHLAA